MTGWARYEPDRCDLCPRRAKWRHRSGGLRCARCPRPEEAVDITPPTHVEVRQFRTNWDAAAHAYSVRSGAPFDAAWKRLKDLADAGRKS